MKELQQLKANTAETASLVVGSQAEKESLCRDTHQMMSYYDRLKNNMKVSRVFAQRLHDIFYLAQWAEHTRPQRWAASAVCPEGKSKDRYTFVWQILPCLATSCPMQLKTYLIDLSLSVAEACW